MCFAVRFTKMGKLIIFVLVVTLLTWKSEGSHLKMPSFSFVGESVTMECNIDHGDLPIIAITWSKDGQVFYKYDPNNPDPVTIFNVTGIQVKKDLSLNGNSITIGSVVLESNGVYTCNVEIDHPSLNNGKMSGSLKIVRSF